MGKSSGVLLFAMSRFHSGACESCWFRCFVGAYRLVVLLAAVVSLVTLGACGPSRAANGATDALTPVVESSPEKASIPSPLASPVETATPETAPPQHTPVAVVTASTSTALPTFTRVPPKLTPTTRPTAVQSNFSLVSAGEPLRLRIPAIGVDAVIEPVGIAADGSMGLPKGYDTVAWYMLGPRPGEKGNAAIAGHLDSTTGPAVFWRLRQLQVGDKVYVYSTDNVEREFEVIAKETYPDGQAPIMRIFGPAEQRNLNLITCVGVFDRAAHNYSDRLVVYTQMTSP